MRKSFELLRDYRKSKGLTQKFVAEKSGISPKKLSRIENGHIQLTADDLVTVCVKAFSVNPGNFFDEEFSKNEN